MDWEKALEIASHVTHPTAVVSIALVLASFLFWLVHRAKKTRLAWLLASALIVLGLAPLASFTFLKSRGMYRVRILVQSPDQQPITDATIKTSIGGEIKKAEGTWELDIAPQTRPADRKIMLFAARLEAFQAGTTTVELRDDYYPRATIQLKPLPEVLIRGMVKDEWGRSVRDAKVSVHGYHDVAVTDNMGNFELSAHAAEGQMVGVHAEKGTLVTDVSVPAGVAVDLIVRKIY